MYIKLAKIQEQRNTRMLFKLIEVLVTAMIIAVEVEVPATALSKNLYKEHCAECCALSHSSGC